jgi:hypothetical protein
VTGPSPDILGEIVLEFERIKLRLEDLPGLVINTGVEHDLLIRLRALPVGATWRDVFPEMPEHWVPGRPETWTKPYRPLGPFDYPALPTGPAVHVYWPHGRKKSPLDDLVREARKAGWPVHGAGLIDKPQSEARQFHAHIVLEHGTDEETFAEFLSWIEEQPQVEIAVITRPVNQKFFEQK